MPVEFWFCHVRVLNRDAAEGWWYTFVNAEMLHVKAWLVKWVSCLLNSPCDNLLMIGPNSVESRRCLSRWYSSPPIFFPPVCSPSRIPRHPQHHWKYDTEMPEVISNSGHFPLWVGRIDIIEPELFNNVFILFQKILIYLILSENLITMNESQILFIRTILISDWWR